MKPSAVAAIAVLSAFVGGIAVAAYYETRGRPEAGEALVSLSDHAMIIGLIERGDTRNAIRFLTTLADTDVMRLMSVEGDREESPAYRRTVLSSYGAYRRKNPQFYAVPDYYVDEERRAQYEQNLRDIQMFLDGASALHPESIK